MYNIELRIIVNNENGFALCKRMILKYMKLFRDKILLTLTTPP